MELGAMVSLNQAIDFETASVVATEFEYEVERAAFEEEGLVRREDPRREVVLQDRESRIRAQLSSTHLRLACSTGELLGSPFFYNRRTTT